MFVREYMTPDPIVAGPDMSYPDAMSLIRKRKIRRLPVMERERLVGIVVEKDLLSNQPSPATTLSVFEIYSLLENLRVRQIMTRPVVTVGGDCPVEEAARIMVEHKIGCLPVMRDEALVGIITETDIFKALVEVLGGQETGFRLTLRLPERVGELARISSRIAEAGGNILAVTSSRLLESGQRVVTLKAIGVQPEALQDVMHQESIEVVDMRPTSRYEPRLVG